MREPIGHRMELDRLLQTHADYRAWYQDEITAPPEDGIYRDFYPVPLWRGGELHLPLRRLALSPDGEGDIGIALLMTSEVDHDTLGVLTDRMAERIRQHQYEVGHPTHKIAGIAKLGYSLGQRISERLYRDGDPNHHDWIPVDSSAKLWYDQSGLLSASASSITSGDTGKIMQIDPHIAHRVYGNRVALVDDAINTFGSARAAALALHNAGAAHVTIAPLFTEGHDWEERAAEIGLDPASDVISLGHLPIFAPLPDGSFQILPDTA